MEVIQQNAWAGEKADIPKNHFFYGIRDLTSDYYQVLIEHGRPRWCRIVWMFILLILLAFTGYMAYEMISDYCEFGSYDRINMNTGNSSLTLPSVEICSLNPLNYTKMVEELGKNHGNVVKELEKLMLDLNLKNDNDFGLNAKDYANLIAYEKENGPLFFLYRNDAQHLLSKTKRYDYKLGDIGHDIKNWLKDSGSNEMGSCIELNDDSALKQTLGGSRYGLTLDIDAALDTYPPFAKSAGLHVIIKDHDETMFFDDGGFVVYPGTETFVQVTVTERTRLNAPWGNCNTRLSQVSKYKSTHESRKECLHVGKVMEMVNSTQHCGCIPWYVIKRLKDAGRTEFLDELVKLISGSSNSKTKRSWDGEKSNINYTQFYGPKDAAEMMKYNTYEEYFVKGLKYAKYMCDSFAMAKCDNKFPKYWQDQQKKFADICQPPCGFNHYDVGVTSTRFPPTESYFNGYLKSHNKQEYTWAYARENLVRLHIYYEKMEFRTIAQTADYEIQNFIGELGGTVDLFIGFSFFTVFQLLEIFVACIFVNRCWKKKKPEDVTNANGKDVIEMNRV